jgi:hypothetical protein
MSARRLEDPLIPSAIHAMSARRLEDPLIDIASISSATARSAGVPLLSQSAGDFVKAAVPTLEIDHQDAFNWDAGSISAAR